MGRTHNANSRKVKKIMTNHDEHEIDNSQFEAEKVGNIVVKAGDSDPESIYDGHRNEWLIQPIR